MTFALLTIRLQILNVEEGLTSTSTKTMTFLSNIATLLRFDFLYDRHTMTAVFVVAVVVVDVVLKAEVEPFQSKHSLMISRCPLWV